MTAQKILLLIVCVALASAIATPKVSATPPCIIRQPLSQTVPQGSNVTFGVTAFGNGPLTYQWRSNGATVDGATNANLTLTNLQPSQAANYMVEVAQPDGVMPSALATLTVVDHPIYPVDWPDLRFTTVASNLFNFTQLTHAGDGSGRIFLVEQSGRIRILSSTGVVATPFLNISDRVTGEPYDERGLLSVVFPPCYSTKGYFYVNYSQRPGDATVVSRFFVTKTNANLADPASEQIVLRIPQPYPNHNGGQLMFGPDGFLYIGMGDGGSHGDPENRAQDPASLLGKMLRIDAEATTNGYIVPSSNPFVANAAYRPEIWALGLRNPWRFSFDRFTGDLYIADVGEDSWEEIDFQPSPSTGGENYGWRLKEGSHDYNLPCGSMPNSLTPPIAEYGHDRGVSVIGGFVYRGPGNSRMQGIYFYGDFGSYSQSSTGWVASTRIWGLKYDGANWQGRELAQPNAQLSAFGEDEAGRLYAVDYFNGRMLRLDDSGVALLPALDPTNGIFNAPGFMRVTCPTPGVVIHYTSDGRDPTEADAGVASGDQVMVGTNSTLKARAYRSDLLPSGVSSLALSFAVATPSFDPPGPLLNTPPVSISSLTPDAIIRYTTDGSEPSNSSAAYSQPVQIVPGVTLKAKGFRLGYTDSPTRIVYYGSVRYEHAMVTTLVGGGCAGYQDGFGTNAQFSSPQGICIDSVGNLYVADTGNHRIRKVTFSNEVVTVAGSGSQGNVNGPGCLARFNSPVGITLASDQRLYVNDTGAGWVRRVDVTGNVSNFYNVGFNSSAYLEANANSNVFVAIRSYIFKLKLDGNYEILGGQLSKPTGIGLDGSDNILGAVSQGWISRTSPAGVQEIFGGTNAAGVNDGPRFAARFLRPTDITVDRIGNIYVSDGSSVRKIGSDGNVTTLAGSSILGYVDGPGEIARFGNATGLCVDNLGQIFVCDSTNNVIRKITQIDWDGDGIPDAEEGGSTPFVVGVDDRLVDSDGDGQSNAAEYLAGTDPQNANSLFALRNIRRRNGGCVSFEWQSAANRSYSVESSDDLKTWSASTVLNPPQPDIVGVTNCPAANNAQRFYRVRVFGP